MVAGCVVRAGTTALICARPAARGVSTTVAIVAPAGMLTGAGAGMMSGALDVKTAVTAVRYGDPTSSRSKVGVFDTAEACAGYNAASSLTIVTVETVVPKMGSAFVDAGASTTWNVLSGSGSVFPRIWTVTVPEVLPAAIEGPYPASKSLHPAEPG